MRLAEIGLATDKAAWLTDGVSHSIATISKAIRGAGYDYDKLPDLMKEAGFAHRYYTGPWAWNLMHNWCKERFGPRNYAWSGSNFYFESEDDADDFHYRCNESLRPIKQRDFPYAIKVRSLDGFCKDMEAFEQTIDCDGAYSLNEQEFWVGLRDRRQAMWARMVCDGDFVDLSKRNLDPL